MKCPQCGGVEYAGLHHAYLCPDCWNRLYQEPSALRPPTDGHKLEERVAELQKFFAENAELRERIKVLEEQLENYKAFYKKVWEACFTWGKP